MTSVHSPAAVAPPQMPLLPNECLLIVARYSEGATLQNFRLSSKAFQKIADPVLWKEIRLVPNVDCLSTFCDLIAERSIASHIQTLVYDTSWQSFTDEIKAKSDKADAVDAGQGEVLDRTVLARCMQAQVKSAEGKWCRIVLFDSASNQSTECTEVSTHREACT